MARVVPTHRRAPAGGHGLAGSPLWWATQRTATDRLLTASPAAV